MAYEEIRMKQEAEGCLLCHNAPCEKSCDKKVAISKIIRSLRFENITGAKKSWNANRACLDCDGSCMEQCIKGKMNRPVDILSMMKDLDCLPVELADGTPDLSIEFCGVKCENPFFLSSSVVGSNYEMVAKAFEMGWAGVAFKTIGFFTPDEVSPRFATLDRKRDSFAGFKNIEQISDHSFEENIDFIKRLKKDYPEKVIIASIMGQNEEEWEKLAAEMEKAGADIIECNFSCPQMVGEGLGSDVGTNLDLVCRYTEATRRGTTLPVLAKMTPNITRMELPARIAVVAGADGIAAINTIKSVMNVDLTSFGTEPMVEGKSSVGGYSGRAVRPIALRFISDMKKDPKLKSVPVSGMGGIENWRDAAEFIALGCETVQVTTAVMQYGYRIIDDLIGGLSDYLAIMGMQSVTQLVGKGLPQIVGAEALNRSTIEYPKFHRETCIGCGRCYISCFDGGHQALSMDSETNQPVMDPKKCVGCQLCRLVCPSGSISAGVRVLKKNKNEK